MMFLRLLVILPSVVVIVSVSAKKQRTTKFVFVDGDVIIGGLSPVHFSPIDESGLDPDAFACQGEFNPRGFEAIEAMLFTMDILNHGHLKDVVLPNITIGMDIKETCTTADHAVRESLKFSFIQNANEEDNEQCSDQTKILKTKTVAVVGAAYSGVSMAVTNLCGLFYVPLVSYASTSRLLSNKVQFRYFFRTVPSDMLQAQVMADLVKAMNWNYVITLASDTEYGRSGIEAFKQATQRLHNYHICIPVHETFTKRSDEKTFDKIFAEMKKHPKAKVVILFAELHDAQILIDKIRDKKVKEKYIWIGSDAWADSKEILTANEAILNGMFAIVPEVRKIDKFVQYFVNFNEERRKRNPWMQEYEDVKVAYAPAFHRQTFQSYSKAPYVMDAVLSIAYALHDVLGCKPSKDCSPMKYKLSSQNFRKDFVKHLEKVRFPAISRDYMSFDNDGEVVGLYDIKNLKLVGKNAEFFEIGKWGSGNCVFNAANASSNCLKLDKHLLNHRLFNPNDTKAGIPFSRCSATCPPGYHKVAEKDFAKCCWSCRKCTGNTISSITDSHECSTCPKGYWPDKFHSKCEPIQPKTTKLTDAAAIIIFVSIGIGIIAVFGTFLVFFFYRETAVVKASSRELCYVLLLGIFWCYATPILYILEPTDTICLIMPYATGLCPSLVVGALLTKTNRISRIFNRRLSQSGAAACLSKKWQVLLVLCIACFEITLCTIYIASSDTGRIVTFKSTNEVIIDCKSMPDIWVAVWWAYIVGLVVTCTYQAFLTRKLPENYNEAKFITFTMLITCIVVVMFIPTYIGTSGVYRTVISCFVFIIGGSAALGCMFVPKLYIILWRPEKNVPMQPKSSFCIGNTTPKESIVRRLTVDYTAVTEMSPISNYKHTKFGRLNSEPAQPSPELASTEHGEECVGPRKRLASLPVIFYQRGMLTSSFQDIEEDGKNTTELTELMSNSTDNDGDEDDTFTSPMSKGYSCNYKKVKRMDGDDSTNVPQSCTFSKNTLYRKPSSENGVNLDSLTSNSGLPLRKLAFESNESDGELQANLASSGSIFSYCEIVPFIDDNSDSNLKSNSKKVSFDDNASVGSSNSKDNFQEPNSKNIEQLNMVGNYKNDSGEDNKNSSKTQHLCLDAEEFKLRKLSDLNDKLSLHKENNENMVPPLNQKERHCHKEDERRALKELFSDCLAKNNNFIDSADNEVEKCFLSKKQNTLLHVDTKSSEICNGEEPVNGNDTGNDSMHSNGYLDI